MDDEFEDQYADELEALNDFDEELPKSKKSLDFATPSTKHKGRVENGLDDSIITPLDDSGTGHSPDTHMSKAFKRSNGQMFADLSDEEAELVIDADLPALEPRRKRPRISAPADEITRIPDDLEVEREITPPPSPDEITLVKRHQNRQILETAVTRLQQYHELEDAEWRRPRVLRRVPDSDFISARGLDGRHVYMVLKDKTDIDKEASESMHADQSLSMLGTSIAELKAEVEQRRARHLQEESQQLTSYIYREGIADDIDEDYTEENTTESDQEERKEEALWVQQYAPKAYTELLSDESTNRTLLRWLKLWDHLVFGKERKKDKQKEKNSKKENSKKQNYKHAPEVEEELDPQGRPMQKVVLLCGPPGLGKTTLAHVVGQHAGYNVVEMNASDDRSVEAFKTKIDAATQMKAVLGADPRPNCLVIDEIDGAPVAAINVLLSVIKRTGQPTGKRKKKEGDLLRRPIICICNDLYTPSLRQLRQNALVIHFPQTVSSMLASRLMEISRKERLRADMSALLALCEKSDNDIRSCLNTLQFAKGRGQEVTMQVVQSSSIGQKDAHKSLFTVWQHIFKLPKAKRKRYVNPHDRANTDWSDDMAAFERNTTSVTSRFHGTLHMVYAAGEEEKIMQGLHENYLEVKVKDPHLHKLNVASEWLCFVDQLHQVIQHTQNYTVGRYIPYMPVMFHLLFASNAPNKITYPHSQYELVTKQSRSNTLVTGMMTEVVPSVRKHMNLLVTIMEILPHLLDIIQPTLRPVNTQLYSGKEKEDLAKLIKIMVAYNLSYRQERTVEGQYIFVLEPSVDDLVNFPGVKIHKQLTYAAKQLISREIELEKMRKSEGAIELKESMKKAKAAITTGAKKEATPAELPNYKRQKLEPKPIIVEEEKAPQDFFGRTIEQKPAETREGETENKKKEINTDIWFHFKAGFTNAVRKTVKVQDLL